MPYSVDLGKLCLSNVVEDLIETRASQKASVVVLRDPCQLLARYGAYTLSADFFSF
jgi:hypothetical protein